MKLLVDTHVLLWIAYAPTRIAATTRKAMQDGDREDGYTIVTNDRFLCAYDVPLLPA